jgi:hypothetical protein
MDQINHPPGSLRGLHTALPRGPDGAAQRREAEGTHGRGGVHRGPSQEPHKGKQEIPR